MKRITGIRNLVITALFIALCVVLPLAFHAVPDAGSIISPIHIPALLCGLICGPFYGLACGLLGTLLSSVITNMPPMAYLPPMLVEMAVYGFVSGLMMKLIRTKKIYVDLYASLISAMLIGRILAGLAKGFIFAAGFFTIEMWAVSYFVTALPGIIIHLALIPTIVFALEKTKLIPRRYPELSKKEKL